MQSFNIKFHMTAEIHNKYTVDTIKIILKGINIIKQLMRQKRKSPFHSITAGQWTTMYILLWFGAHWVKTSTAQVTRVRDGTKNIVFNILRLPQDFVIVVKSPVGGLNQDPGSRYHTGWYTTVVGMQRVGGGGKKKITNEQKYPKNLHE